MARDSINRQTDRLQLYFDACHAIALEAQQNEFVLDSGRFQDILDRETLDNLLTPTPKSSFDESLVDFPPDGDLANADANFGRNTPLVRSARSTQSIGSAVEEDSPSSDEGGKQTPKATIYRAPSPPARGGFFSRLLPFRSSSNAGQSKTSDSEETVASCLITILPSHIARLLISSRIFLRYCRAHSRVLVRGIFQPP
ncbi:unnamed protein product [Schistocephalus solidus]|uniref:Uncharacterized protein n=1 Tax=Schistocephalus solidus TaxID=70667 RepID=A0A183TDF0_SCHSO|nr:unnamed protein product [Schistocephalus solidus]